MDKSIRTPSMIEGSVEQSWTAVVMPKEVVGLRRPLLANGGRRNANAQDD